MTRKVPLITGGEARYHDTDRGKHMQLDEVVSAGSIHIERMSPGHVWMAIEGPDGRVCVHFTGRVRMHVSEGELPA